MVNRGDRPVPAGLHFYFYELNQVLEFGRFLICGMRLHIAAGCAVSTHPAGDKVMWLKAMD